MKYFLLLTILFCSCKKEKSNCHNCSLGSTINQAAKDTVICGVIPSNITDINGSDISFYCKEQ